VEYRTKEIPAPYLPHTSYRHRVSFFLMAYDVKRMENATIAKFRSNVVEAEPFLNSFHWPEGKDMAASAAHPSHRLLLNAGLKCDQLRRPTIL
jgi:hypothetical protein